MTKIHLKIILMASGTLSAAVCIDRKLIQQGSICIDLQDIGVDLPGHGLADNAQYNEEGENVAG